MAVLTAPLLSLAASGTIGDALTYASWKGIPYARVRVIPANPQSVAQQEVRGVFSTLNEMWKRMPADPRIPWDYAVRGLALTARNRHIQANVAALIDQANLDNLVMSVATGQAIPPAGVTPAENPPGSVELTCVAPTVPVGYTLLHYIAAVVQDGDPSPVLIRTTFTGNAVAPALVITVAVSPASVTYQWGVWCHYNRDADDMRFISEAVRGTQAVA